MDSGNHYVVKVKKNQPKLLRAVKQTVEDDTAIQTHIRKEMNRGRFETRITSVFHVRDNIPEGWPALHRIVFVQREFLSKDKTHRTDSFYITDLKTDDAKYLAEGIRGHWHIENKLHYTKDVTMKEDRTCTKNKNAAPKLALFRDFAYDILKKKNKSIKYATEFFANNNIKELWKILIRT